VEVFTPPPLPLAEAPAPLLPALPTIRRRHRAAVVVAGASCFFLLVAMVVSAGTPGFDDEILRGLRSPDDPAVPNGPRWLTGTMRDVTALGGYTVLTLLSLAAAGYFAVRQKWAAVVRVVAAGVGAAMCDAVKLVFARPRPAVVSHLDEVSTASFPSSHAAASAAVYLTLALVFAGRRPRVRRFLLTVAVLLSLLVGFSRVFLGVHFPTDVLGGWAVGVGWAAVCEMVAVWLRSRR
jgi:undecaprenyl-diphosphatase